MPVNKKASRSVRRFTRRIVKGVILLIWIIVLFILAIAAATESASNFIIGLKPYLGTSSYLYYDAYYEIDNVMEPTEYLEYYTRPKENPPPIDAVLDELDGNLSWRNGKISEGSTVTESTDPNLYTDWHRKQYESLFKVVETQLRRIARNPSISPLNEEIHNDGFPVSFKELNSTGDGYVRVSVKLPPAAVAWVESERIRLSSDASKGTLFNTFLLLVVLGAFGSLIFLTRDYIEVEHTTTIASYIFRPVLGMFLAMAMFIVTLLGHAIVSTGDLLQIRHETLYGLALAAGLLSEQAYGVVNLRAQAALQRLQDEQESASESAQEPTASATTKKKTVPKKKSSA